MYSIVYMILEVIRSDYDLEANKCNMSHLDCNHAGAANRERLECLSLGLEVHNIVF